MLLRILLFLIAVFAIATGFVWLADRPGAMTVTFQGYQYQLTLMTAAVVVFATVAALLVLWWIVKAVWYSPYTVSRYFRVRRRDRGYQALSTGMIAAGAGDAALARLKNKEAAKLIRADQEPLIHLLEAQTLLLEGKHEAARDKFEQMVDDPETRLLGLRGLYVEAARQGNRVAARHYAARAAQAAPQLGWAADSTIEEKGEQGDWESALKLLEAQKATLKADKTAYYRRRAVLLTAKAMADFDTAPAAARSQALEANKLAPDFAPTALIAARCLFRSDEVRKGSKILEAAWRKNPNPDLADLYVHARHGDAAADRLARAKRLQSLHTNHPESALAVARAALEANDFGLAREEAQASIRMSPREGAYLLLADIEEADGGDAGRVREWLSRAVRAPRDPAWVADGIVSEHWAPQSPVTGRIDAFEWRVPVERLGPAIEQDEPEAPVLIAAPEPEPVIEAKPAKAEIVDVVEVVEDAPVPQAKPEVVPDAQPEAAPQEAAPQEAAVMEDVKEPKRSKKAQSEPEPVVKFVDLPTARDFAARDDDDKLPPLARRMPDDPGVEPADTKS